MRPHLRVFAAALMACVVTPGFAQEPQCKSLSTVVNDLHEQYRETAQGFGLSFRGNLTILFSSDKTWTIVLMKPDGSACLVDGGSSWQPPLPQMTPGVDS